MQHQARLLNPARPLLEKALASDRGSGASPAGLAAAGDATPPGELAWQWVSPQLLLVNSKGEEIFYPIVDDTDRSWVRRLESVDWAIGCHRNLAEADFNALQTEFEKALQTSRVARRDNDRLYIKYLQEQLESEHKRFRDLWMHSVGMMWLITK